MKDPWYSDTRAGHPPWAGHSSQPARKTAGPVLTAMVIGAVVAVLWAGVHPLQAGAQHPAEAAAAPTHAPVPAADLSGLHLNTATDTAGDENSISVHYQPTLPGNEAADVVGLGGATWSSPSGRITHGDVWIKNTSPDNTPGTPYAREIMLHELMHALGIKHAPDGSAEIMAPALPPGPPLEPGPRDKASLNAAGCPHP